MNSYTVNVSGNKVNIAKMNGYHAYYSEYTNVTAIEIKAIDKKTAKHIASRFGKVLFCFE